jgi:hypothetical protein
MATFNDFRSEPAKGPYPRRSGWFSPLTDKLGNTGRKTGFWLVKLAAPHFVFKDAGAEIVLA